MNCKCGVIGLAVMGENLCLNIARNSSVCVFNRDTEKVKKFINVRAKNTKIIGTYTLQEFVKNIAKPRIVILMVKAGEAVDFYTHELMGLLDKGDIIIDGGNSHFLDSKRHYDMLASAGINFVSCGISGGEEGALNGPCIMPSGGNVAKQYAYPLLCSISAKYKGEDCCKWLSDGVSGHYVKMIHNGIEYGDMQLISEVFLFMRDILNLEISEIADIFDEWNKAELNSYLIEITAKILRVKENGEYLINTIKDIVNQKGTGKWSVNSANDIGVPLTLIYEAVSARILSGMKSQRIDAQLLYGTKTSSKLDKEIILPYLKDALYSAKIISYAQGFGLMYLASKYYVWNLNFSDVAKIWRNGCIIRSNFLNDISNVYSQDQGLINILLTKYFSDILKNRQNNYRQFVEICIHNSLPVPALVAALSYFDSYKKGSSGANLIAAQRDYFGAHTFEKIGKENQFFHYDWSGLGSTSSSNYNV